MEFTRNQKLAIIFAIFIALLLTASVIAGTIILTTAVNQPTPTSPVIITTRPPGATSTPNVTL